MLLAERSGLQKEFSEEQMDFLAELNPFQLEGRYPGARQILYKQQPKKIFEELINRTEVLIKWLEQKLKSEAS